MHERDAILESVFRGSSRVEVNMELGTTMCVSHGTLSVYTAALSASAWVCKYCGKAIPFPVFSTGNMIPVVVVEGNGRLVVEGHPRQCVAAEADWALRILPAPSPSCVLRWASSQATH